MMQSKAFYKLSKFEYFEGIDGPKEDFVCEFTKIVSFVGDEISNVYKIQIPENIYRIGENYTKIVNPKTVFYPRYKGMNSLDTAPKECPGGIAIEAFLTKPGVVSMTDFLTFVRCMATPL